MMDFESEESLGLNFHSSLTNGHDQQSEQGVQNMAKPEAKLEQHEKVFVKTWPTAFYEGILNSVEEVDLNSDDRRSLKAVTPDLEYAEPPELDSRTVKKELLQVELDKTQEKNRTEEVVDLNTDDNLQVDISDALSERDKVKYTVHTKTSLHHFSKPEVSVVREHEEFIWLHNCLAENENYSGYIIPPAPPRPDFDVSREKLQKLAEGESTMTKDEFQKMKQELEQEYLATFKKTVAMHEVFLQRLAVHAVFRKDTNFRVFLEYENELAVRGRNKKEVVGSFLKRFTQSADEVLLSGQKDVDEFFEREKNYIIEYHSHIKDTMSKADRVCRLKKNIAEAYGKVAGNMEKWSQMETANGEKDFGRFLARMGEVFERLKKTEARCGTDEELKLADTLRYFSRESEAAKDLLYRRTRCLANYESANKNLERARAKNREIQKAESDQADACKKFEEISALAKNELLDLKRRRVSAFKKNLTDFADLQVKHTKTKISLLQSVVASLKEDQ